MQLLKECPEWYLDGTFKTCPLVFQQVYTVHVKLEDGKVVPAVYALLPGKDAMCYRKLLDVISGAIDGFHPQLLHVDFELAMIRELEIAFPSAGIVGCNFHFNQCLYRFIQSDSELYEMCRKSPGFELRMKMFSALAFVPPEDVRSSFDALLRSPFVVRHQVLLTRFVNYFEKTWVGRERNPSIMKSEWWNLNAVVLNGLRRTSNAIEGWHSGFAKRLGVTHPSFSAFVEFLKIEQGRTEFIVSNSRAQGLPSLPKKQYRDRDLRLKELAESYGQRPLIPFLMSCAHNIAFETL